MAALLGDWPWVGLCDSVVLALKIPLTRKSQEKGVVGFIRNHVVISHCKATDWYGKLHAILLIICVSNVTKYFFLCSVSVQFYAKHTSIFITFYFGIIQKKQKQIYPTKIIGKHWKTVFASTICWL